MDDIKIFPGGIWKIKRTGSNKCNCKNMHMENMHRGAMSANKPTTCHGWCDYFATAGELWCCRSFASYACQFSCISSVSYIKSQLCYRCCDSGDFYRTCIQPFAEIVSYIGQRCDPAWD